MTTSDLLDPHGTISLGGDVRMPRLGFGVFQVPGAETAAAVTSALEAGYRSIDTAAVYGNEAEVGAAIAASGVPRDELFVTTKLWNDDQGHDAALTAVEVSLEKLGLDHVDLYLIHWPAPARELYPETWTALEQLLADGRTRAIGVSNFRETHLRRVLDLGGTVPAVNQVELHPRLQQRPLRDFHDAHGIVTEAWSPLGQGGVLDDPVLEEIAERLGRTPAQVVLRWHLQQGRVVIPKSVTPSRIAANRDVTGFVLTDEELTAIDDLDVAGGGGRIGPDPDELS